MNESTGAHLQAFLRDPKGVAALLPTSPFIVDHIASRVAAARPDLIVEYGPGSGVLTRRLLEALEVDGRLVAIERNPDFATRLESRLDDPRLTVVRGSAEEVLDVLYRLGLPRADYVLSGIPFFFLAPATALEIVANTHAALRDGGRFLTYQTFYQGRRHLRIHLERCFSSVKSQIDLRNLPPYRICEALK